MLVPTATWPVTLPSMWTCACKGSVGEVIASKRLRLLGEEHSDSVLFVPHTSVRRDAHVCDTKEV